jgi:hypothetical protein
MPDLGRLSATATLDAAGFENPLRSARAALGVSFGAFKSAEGIVEGFKGVFETGRELKAQAAITGQSIRDLVVLRKTWALAGQDVGSLTTTLGLMQNALGGVNDEGQPTKKVFEELGLSIEALKGQSAIQQLAAIGKAIRNLGDQESKMAATRAIFGRGGAGVLAIIQDPKIINQAAAMMGETADVYQRNAAHFADLANQIESIGTKVKGIFVGAAGDVAPAIEPILAKIRSIDTVGAAKKIADTITQYVQVLYAAFQSGDLGKLLSLGLQAGIEDAAPKMENRLITIFKNALTFLGDGLKKLKDGELSGLSRLKQGVKMVIAGDAIRREKQQESADQARLRQMESKLTAYDKGYTLVSRGNDKFDNVANNPEYQALKAKVHAELAKIGADEAKLQSKLTKQQRTTPKGLLGEKSVNPWKEFNAEWARQKAKVKAALAGATDASAPGGSGKFEAVKDIADKARGKDAEADRLAKIGLFVGGASPQNDHARKIADNTGKLVQIFTEVRDLDRGILDAMGRGGAGAAAWGLG